jgi:hypothetical protein
MPRAIERHARLGLLLALAATACTSGHASGGPSDASADVNALQADASGEFQSPTDDDACALTVSIQASSFDQACASDLDCMAVGQGNACAECGFACPSAAIRKDALAAFRAAVADAGGPFTGTCFCPAYGNPCCHQGKCSSSCDDEITDIDACAAVGGTCVPYAAVPDGGPSCVRISYCAANPSVSDSTIGVCCPAPIADGGAD